MQFETFLRQRLEAGGFTTEDALSAFLPLLRQVVEAHERGAKGHAAAVVAGDYSQAWLAMNTGRTCRFTRRLADVDRWALEGAAAFEALGIAAARRWVPYGPALAPARARRQEGTNMNNISNGKPGRGAAILLATVLAASLLPARLSASQVQSLVDCPYQFYGRRLLRLEAPEDVLEEPGKREFGEALHEVLRNETRGTGIRASLISPGPTDTNLWDPLNPDARDDLPSRRDMLNADDVANAVLFALTQPATVNVDELRLSRS